MSVIETRARDSSKRTASPGLTVITAQVLCKGHTVHRFLMSHESYGLERVPLVPAVGFEGTFQDPSQQVIRLVLRDHPLPIRPEVDSGDNMVVAGKVKSLVRTDSQLEQVHSILARRVGNPAVEGPSELPWRPFLHCTGIVVDGAPWNIVGKNLRPLFIFAQVDKEPVSVDLEIQPVAIGTESPAALECARAAAKA